VTPQLLLLLLRRRRRLCQLLLLRTWVVEYVVSLCLDGPLYDLHVGCTAELL
jgi:hypothetical protein